MRQVSVGVVREGLLSGIVSKGLCISQRGHPVSGKDKRQVVRQAGCAIPLQAGDIAVQVINDIPFGIREGSRRRTSDKMGRVRHSPQRVILIPPSMGVRSARDLMKVRYLRRIPVITGRDGCS